MKLQVVTLDNQKSGDIELNDAVFGVEVRQDLLQRMVRYQLAKRQAGTHKAKTIDEISGTTKKPFKQKGTGRARQGRLRSVQMRGGAVAHGPVVRSHAFSLNKKVRALALKTALSMKAANGDLLVVDSFDVKEAKTAQVKKQFAALGLKSALFVDGVEVNGNFKKAVANLYRLDVLPQIGANVYDILLHEKLVLTKEAVAKLEERLA